ncbi:MAG: hypothetical protein U9N77_09380, partial [Thermodesulfobacteriota bacterium]|nr:hypothetical protein [Thermodesulfobacteriota bacterium]
MFLKNIAKKIIILFCLILFPLSGYAQNLVIMTNEWTPYVSSKLKNYGFTAEIISQAFAVAGIKPVIEFAPWSRCEAGVKNGKIFAA